MACSIRRMAPVLFGACVFALLLQAPPAGARVQNPTPMYFGADKSALDGSAKTESNMPFQTNAAAVYGGVEYTAGVVTVTGGEGFGSLIIRSTAPGVVSHEQFQFPNRMSINPDAPVGGVPSIAANGRYVYWTATYGFGDSDSGWYAIYRANADGSDIRALRENTFGGSGLRLAVDQTYLYLNINGAIERMNLDGTPAPTGSPLTAQQRSPLLVLGDQIYYVGPGYATIHHADKNGMSFTNVGYGVSDVSFPTGGSAPITALASDGQHIYWTSSDDFLGVIHRAGLDGQNPTTIQVYPPGSPSPGSLAIENALAASMDLSLADSSVDLDRTHAVQAIARVFDANGDPLYSDDVTYSIGGTPRPMKPYGFTGWYVADVPNAETPQQVTVTASDNSVSPALTVQKTLTYVSGPARSSLITGNGGRMPLDGSGFRRMLNNSTSKVVAQGGYVYWADVHYDASTAANRVTIGRSRTDGSQVDRDFVLLPDTDDGPATVPYDLAVDADHVYFVVGASRGSGAQVGRVNRDGTGAAYLPGVQASFPDGMEAGLAVDDEHLYIGWLNRIDRASLDGSDRAVNFISADAASYHNALTVYDGYLYWGDSQRSGISRAKVDGTGVTRPFIAGPEDFLSSIAVDGRHLYWGSPTNPVVRRANIDGTNVSIVPNPRREGAQDLAVALVATNVTLSLSPASIGADGTSTSVATATVKDEFGNPVSGDVVTITTPDGQMITPVIAGPEPGTYRATITSTTDSGDSVITATDTSAPTTPTKTATLTQRAVTPARVSTTLSKSTISADGVDSTTLTATVTDARDHPVTGLDVDIELGATNSQQAADQGDGTYTRTFSTTAARDYAVRAVVHRTGGLGDLTSDPRTLTATAGLATKIKTTVTPATLAADGASTTEVRVDIADAHNNGVTGEDIRIGSTDAGHQIGEVTQVAGTPGRYRATLRASSALGTSTITGTDWSVTPHLQATDTLEQIVGPASSIAVGIAPGGIVADGTAVTTATATVTDAKGHPISGHAVRFYADGASIGLGTGQGDGTYTKTYGTTVAGPHGITAHDESVTPELSSSAVTLTASAGPATKIETTLTPDELLADETSTTQVRMTVADAHDNPVSSDTISVGSSDADQVVGVVVPDAAHPGRYVATLRASKRVGESTVTGTDSTVATPISDTATLTQTVGPATKVGLTLTPSSILANSTSQSVAQATVTDAWGHPLSGEDVAIETDGGQPIGDVTAGSLPGTYEATITSTATPGTSKITAADSSVGPPETGEATLTQRSQTDPLPPTATIAAPVDGGTYNLAENVTTQFSCADAPAMGEAAAGPGIDTCTDSGGDASSPGTLDTAAAGLHTYTVTAVSLDGQRSTASIQYRVLGPPLATIRSPAGGATYAKDQVVATAFTCSDAAHAPGIQDCKDSADAPSSAGGTLNTSTLGGHTYTVTATSEDGQTGTAAISYTVAAPPSATIKGPVDNQTYTIGQNVVTQFSCTESTHGPGIQTCTDSGGASGTTGVLDTTAPGSHAYRVTATSSDGQTGTATIHYKVAARPTATIATPSGGGTYNLGQFVPTSFTCDEGSDGPGIQSCVDSGATMGFGQLDTGATGTRAYTVTATSINGQVGTKTITYTVIGPPTATITAPAENQTYTIGQNVATQFICAEVAGGPGLASCSDAAGATTSGTLDTATAGPHTYTVTATSSGGQTGTATLHYIVAARPTAAILAPANNQTYNQTQAVATQFTCAEGANGPGIQSCEDSGGAAGTTGTLDTATAGAHTYTVTATSKNGQTATKTISYTVIGPPTATIVSPIDEQSFNIGQTVTTQFACAEAAGGPGITSCRDSRGATGTSGTLDTATTGPHTYTVTATSQTGQTAAATIRYTVAGAPTVSISSQDNVTHRLGADPEVTFNCSEGLNGPGLASCEDSNGATSPARLNTSAVGSFTYTVTATSQNGQTRSLTMRYRVIGVPTATLNDPAMPNVFAYQAKFKSTFTCADIANGPGIRHCYARSRHLTRLDLESFDQSSPGIIDASEVGDWEYTVTAVTRDGWAASKSYRYKVVYAPLTGTITAQGDFQMGQQVKFTAEGAGGRPPYTYEWDTPTFPKGWWTGSAGTDLKAQTIAGKFNNDGKAGVRVKVNDAIGNSAVVERDYKLARVCKKTLPDGALDIRPRVPEGCFEPVYEKHQNDPGAWGTGTAKPFYRTFNDIEVNGQAIEAKWGSYIDIVPGDAMMPTRIMSGLAIVRLSGSSTVLQDGALNWQVPSLALAEPVTGAATSPAVQAAGRGAKEVQISGIGLPANGMKFFGMQLAGGVQWYAGTDANGTPYTRFDGNIAIPAFKSGDEKSPEITAEVSVRIDASGTHMKTLFVQIQHAKLGEDLGIENLCLSFIAAGISEKDEATKDGASRCAVFEGPNGDPYLSCDSSSDMARWDGTAEVELPFKYIKGIKASVGVADSKFRYVAVAADFGRSVPLYDKPPTSWLREMRAGFCHKPGLVVKGGATITAVPIGLDKESTKIDGDFTYTDTHDDADGKEVGWEATIDGALSVYNSKVGNARLGIGGNNVATIGMKVFDSYVNGAFFLDGFVTGTMNFNNGRFNIEGGARICIKHITCINGEAVLSTTGVSACVTVFPSISFGLLGSTPEVRAGVGFTFANQNFTPMGPGCDIGNWRADTSTRTRSALRAASAAAVAVPFQVAAGERLKTIRLTGGATGPPKVIVRGPKGEVLQYAPPARGMGGFGENMMLEDPTHNATLIQLVNPTAGAWAIEPQGTSTITRLETAPVVPRPTITGKLKAIADGKRRLSYTYTPQSGLAIAFAEVGADNKSQQDLALVTKNCGQRFCSGTVDFKPALGLRGKRNIVARITRDGANVDNAQIVSYTAPGTQAGKVSNLHLRRTANGVKACWTKAADAQDYDVAGSEVVVKNGKTRSGYRQFVPTKTSCATFPALAPDARLRVTVTANDEMGGHGKPVVKTMRLKPLRKPARPSDVRVRRTGRGLVVTWGRAAKGTFKYAVSVRIAGGKEQSLAVNPKCGGVRVQNVARTANVTVKVAGVRSDLVSGSAATVRLDKRVARAGARGEARRLAVSCRG
ncbi:MAG: hypothetical protein QOF76_2404 [Solirubrobacteraceae bacterium]|nr:hypothetical protein [Solirubrobacteraceae bacterium]